MSKLIAVVFPIAISLFAIVCLSCDDYNIVEPRFYDTDEIIEIPDCYRSVDTTGGGDTTAVDTVPHLLPATYWVEACWIQRDAGDLYVGWSIPRSSHVKAYIIRNNGEVEVVLENGFSWPGYHGRLWSAEENGVYGISLQAGKHRETIWFEVEMTIE